MKFDVEAYSTMSEEELDRLHPILQYSNFKFEVLDRTHGYAHCLYKIRKLEGNWPKRNQDLITLVDGRKPRKNVPPPYNGNFGGTVSISDDIAMVKVYID